MAKAKKKRTKKYTGADAAQTRPTITRVQAANRSAAGQWMYERRRVFKTTGIIAGIGLLIAIIVSGIISLF